LAFCAGHAARAQGPTLRVAELRTALLGIDQSTASPHAGRNDAVAALVDYAKALPDPDGQPGASGRQAHGQAGHDMVYADLRDYVQTIDGARPVLINAQAPQGRSSAAHDDAYAALIDYAQRIAPGEPQIKLAKAEKTKSAVKATPGGGATYVGSQACLACHAVQAAAFGWTVMGRVFKNPRNAQERGGCETCHGPGSLHVKAGGGRGVGGIISFRLDDPSHTVEETNAICLSCHERGDRTYWMGSTHQTRDVACGNCHQVMQRVSPRFQLAQGTELETCFQCHKEKRAQLASSAHMPLREGKMTCSDCHNPHGSANESMLVAATINEVCYKCHAEKRGPFLWDHPPVRENCLNCHNPHGSSNEYMLNVARPRLCQQCHTQGHGFPGSPNSRFTVGNACQNCHSQIHGSNSPAGPRFQR
jgi:DmsE family decaheme c-type cytochrome